MANSTIGRQHSYFLARFEDMATPSYMSRLGITAEYLRRNSNRDIIRSQCDDLVKVIDAKILSAHQSGFSATVFELPITFDINGLSRQDSQIMVYSELLRIYKIDKGFANTFLEFQSQSVVHLRIEWLNGMSEQERDQRKKEIMSSTRKPA